MAVVREPVDADSYANENTDNTWGREQRKQMFIRIDAFSNTQIDERKPKLPKQQRRNEAQCVHDRIDNANLLVAPVKVVLDVDDVEHLGHRA